MSEKYVVRCSEESGAYSDTVYWLGRLASIDIPVPRVIGQGTWMGYEYMILTYLPGRDIGLVYGQLSLEEKRQIAKEVVRIQNEVAKLRLDDTADVRPVAYLDDISTKNLLICDGRLSGIIDVDWIGVGDRLTFAALTKTALLNMSCDTDYVEFLLEEMQLNDTQRAAFDFYALMYAVDFMGERGTTFLGRTVEVNDGVVEKLNRIYDVLWDVFVRDVEHLN